MDIFSVYNAEKQLSVHCGAFYALVMRNEWEMSSFFYEQVVL